MTDDGRSLREPADAAARRDALDPTRSFIVQAPAGSGKTELLIQRVLTLLGGVGAPEEIVAITFTRKAAAEMRARVIGALRDAEAETPVTSEHARHTRELALRVLERDRALDWDLTANPARLRMHTIDAFNGTLVRRMPWLSGLGGQPAVLEDARDLYLDAVRRTLARHRDGGMLADAITRVLLHLDNSMSAAEEQLMTLLARRDQWLRLLPDDGADTRRLRTRMETALRRAIGVELQRIAALLSDEELAQLASLAAFASGTLSAAGSSNPFSTYLDRPAAPVARPEDVDRWRELTMLLLTQTGEFRKPAGVRITLGFPARHPEKDRLTGLLESLSVRDDLREALLRVRVLPDAAYTDAQWEITDALFVVLREAVRQLEDAGRRRGVVDLVDMAIAARTALGTALLPTDLALLLEYRLTHILVDEFQDTSVSQFELLELLTAGWSDGDGHTLFLVGDPMQSIYNFREAEVGLFLRAWRDRRIGSVPLHPLTLTVNFRSEAGVVRWVNGTFQTLLPAEHLPEEGAVRYTASSAWSTTDRPDAVRVLARIDCDAAAAAEAVVDAIAAEHAADPLARIAVLVRARPHAVPIVAALHRRGMTYRGVDLAPLASMQVVQDVLALTRALLHPADRTAWLAVLRSPVVGLSLEALHTIAAGDRTRTIPDLVREVLERDGLDDENAKRCMRAWRVLERWSGRRGRRGLRRLVEGAWQALGGPAVCTAAELAAADACFAALDGIDEGGGIPSMQALDDALATLMAPPDPSADGTLEIMTMHKAKGLQFDVVIVPGLGLKQKKDATGLFVWERHSLDSGDELTEFLLTAGSERGGDADPLPMWIGSRASRKRDHEVNRLLYVAATRAIRTLYLAGHVKTTVDRKTGEELLGTPLGGSLLERLWPAVRGDFLRQFEDRDIAVSSAQPITAEDVEEGMFLRRVPTDWSPDAPPAALLPRPVPLAASAAGDDDEAPVMDAGLHASETTRRIGTAVHAVLEWIARDGLETWDALPPHALDAAVRRALEWEGITAGELPGAERRATAAVRNTLEDERGRWVLARHDEDDAELALTAETGGEVLGIRIDRTFVDEGVRWIIDYKTSVHEGADAAAFLDRRCAEYAPQLQRYAEVLRRLDARPVRAALWFPMLRAWREIPV